tara:strand:+ start:1786 stop:4362 length:2577 start_codon:yes stop_codon:yes gene_type:complete
MNLFRWFILRQLYFERLRTLLTIAGVALGVAVVIAIRLANTSSVLGFETALDAMSGKTSLEITGAGIGVDEHRLRDLLWLREYGLVSPVIDSDVVLQYERDDPELVRLLGVDILRDRPFRDYLLEQSGDTTPVTTREFLSLLTDPQAVILTKSFARRHQIDIGDQVFVLAGDRRVELIVKGLLGDEGPAKVLDGNFGLMDIAAAQAALDKIGFVDRIDIQLSDQALLADVEQSIAQRLSAGLIVQRPARRGAQVEKMLSAFHFNLSALSYIALLVGLFLVYNTISVSVISRREEIGMLRTLGVTSRTVLLLFLWQAVSLSLLGCLVGVPLGWLLAKLAVGMTTSTVSTFWIASAAVVPPLTSAHLLMTLIIGIPLAILAAIIPSREAARLSPISAVRNDIDVEVRGRFPRGHLVGAVLLICCGAIFSMFPAVEGLPIFGLGSVLTVVFGASLLVSPMLFAIQGLNIPVRGWFWIERELARTNLGGAIRRLSVSVSALVVSFGMMVAIAIMIGSFRQTVEYWIGQTLEADLFVTAARQSPVGDRAPVSFAVEEALRNHPSTVAIDGFRGVDLPYRDSLVIVGSGRFDVLLEYGSLLFKNPQDMKAALTAAIGESAVVVSETFSLKFDIGTGDVISLPTNAGQTEFEVTGVYYDYSSDRGLVVMDSSTFVRFYDDRRPSGLTAYLKQDAVPENVREEVLEELGSERSIFINTNASLRRQVLEVFDSTFAVTYALEAIAIFVSMFGIAATLLTLAIERKQAIAILRLIGAEKHHLRKMVVIEAMLLGAVSVVIGLLVGVALSLVLIYVINVQSFGWTIQFALPKMFLIQASLLMITGAGLAGLYPAYVVSKANMGTFSLER